MMARDMGWRFVAEGVGKEDLWRGFMRRAWILLFLVMLVSWLSSGGHGLGLAIAAGDPGSPASIGGDSTEETNPHWGCVENSCQQIFECGYDDCTACDYCETEEENACLEAGGTWDTATCSCSGPPCGMENMFACIEDWGTWDDRVCRCSNPCNAGPMELYSVDAYQEFAWCEDDFTVVFHEYAYAYYVQFCQDGRIWDEWTEYEDFGYIPYWDMWGYCEFYDW